MISNKGLYNKLSQWWGSTIKQSSTKNGLKRMLLLFTSGGLLVICLWVLTPIVALPLPLLRDQIVQKPRNQAPRTQKVAPTPTRAPSSAMSTEFGKRPTIDTVIPLEYLTPDPNLPKISVEDRFEIMEMINRHNWAIDTRRYDTIAAFYTNDAIVDHPWGYRKGPKAIVDMDIEHIPEEGVRHWNTSFVLTPMRNGEVRWAAYLVVFKTGKSPGPVTPYIMAHGIQYGTVRKVSSEWKFSRLVLDQVIVSGNDAPQEVRNFNALTADVRATLRE